MKKILVVLLSSLLLILIVLSIMYISKNKETNKEWNERYDRCINSIEAQKKGLENVPAEKKEYASTLLNQLNECVDSGGCYTCRPCNSSPKLSILKFLLDFVKKEGGCTAECRYFCMYTSEHY